MRFLTFDEFQSNAKRNMTFDDDGAPVGHWVPKGLEQRWDYHARAIAIVRKSGNLSSEKVLEMGTMGAQIVHGSHTIDYDKDWHFQGFNPTYLHDARQIPWPIESKRYEWFIALRVFHHLWPLQHECFDEARRVAKNVLIVVPSEVPKTALARTPRTDAGITPRQFLAWTNGRPPDKWIPLRLFGDLYWWSDAASLNSSKPIGRAFFDARINAIALWRSAKKLLRRMQRQA